MNSAPLAPGLVLFTLHHNYLQLQMAHFNFSEHRNLYFQPDFLFQWSGGQLEGFSPFSGSMGIIALDPEEPKREDQPKETMFLSLFDKWN